MPLRLEWLQYLIYAIYTKNTIFFLPCMKELLSTNFLLSDSGYKNF